MEENSSINLLHIMQELLPKEVVQELVAALLLQPTHIQDALAPLQRELQLATLSLSLLQQEVKELREKINNGLSNKAVIPPQQLPFTTQPPDLWPPKAKETPEIPNWLSGLSPPQTFPQSTQNPNTQNNKEKEISFSVWRLESVFGFKRPAAAIFCPSGSFLMGAKEGDEAHNDERPMRRVTLTNGFWLWQTPVTREQFVQVIGYNPSPFRFDLEEVPITSVTWHEAAAFCNALSRQQRLAEVYDLDGQNSRLSLTASVKTAYRGAGYYRAEGWRLPTEAEWEYACRGGSTLARYGHLADVAWYVRNSNGSPHTVQTKQPNDWGLYDTLGNVWEWCADAWKTDAYSITSSTDPLFLSSTERRQSRRGGSFSDEAINVRAAVRHSQTASSPSGNIGFRPCITPKSK